MQKISVGMTTYNSRAFLREQIESIFHQTMLPDEIVVCDDCSNDGTMQLLEELQRESLIPFRIIKNESNMGWVRNFEKCFKLCDGDIIIPCDADDVWVPTKVQKIAQAFDSGNVSYVYHDADIIDEQGVVRGKNINTAWNTPDLCDDKTAFMLRNLRRKGHPNGMCIAFKRNMLDEICPFMIGHDDWINLCAPVFGDVVCLHESLAYYRRHGSNISGNNSKEPQGILRRVFYTFSKARHQKREDWYNYPGYFIEAYRLFLNRFSNRVSETILREIENQIEYKTTMNEIMNSGKIKGLQQLISLYRKGLYSLYRGGGKRVLILDVYYILFGNNTSGNV